MGKKIALIVMIGLFVCGGLAQAATMSKAQAKEELKQLDLVKTYSKETVIPLINCFVTNQQYIQNMYGDYPDKGRAKISELDYCLTRYRNSSVSDAKLKAIHERIINLGKRVTDVGMKLINAYDAYNDMQAKYKSKKDDAIRLQMEAKKQEINEFKRQVAEIGNEFVKVREDYLKWQKDFMAHYVEVRNASMGR